MHLSNDVEMNFKDCEINWWQAQECTQDMQCLFWTFLIKFAI